MVNWKGLIETFENDIGEWKVVKKAVAVAPWGSRVRAEHKHTDGIPGLNIAPSEDLIVDLPEQNRTLAVLEGTKWEIWITPNDELHIVVPRSDSDKKTPPEEYFLASQ